MFYVIMFTGDIMDIVIRKMSNEDKKEVIDMMEVFYSSEAVYTNGSLEIFENDFYACISDNPYIEGYVFVSEDEILGYAMLAKSYSTEFGKQCIWIEDLYIKEEYRGNHIGTMFFDFLDKIYKNVLLRLEVEDENIPAISLYKKSGFEVLPYKEMMKNKRL